MGESSISYIALVLWTIMIIMVWETRRMLWKRFQLYLHPIKPFAWADAYANRKIKFQHPKYKNVEGDGIIRAIVFTKDKGKGGVPKMKLEIDEGAAGITPIWLDSNWSYADEKHKP